MNNGIQFLNRTTGRMTILSKTKLLIIVNFRYLNKKQSNKIAAKRTIHHQQKLFEINQFWCFLQESVLLYQVFINNYHSLSMQDQIPVINLEQQQIDLFQSQKFVYDDFERLADAIANDNTNKKLWGMIGLRQLLQSDLKNLAQNIINAELLPTIVNIAKQSQYSHLKFSAIIILTYLSATHQCQKVVESGGIPLLLDLLQAQQEKFAVQAAWGIQTIAISSQKNKKKIIQGGGLTKMITLLSRINNGQNEDNESMVYGFHWVIYILCSGNPLPSCQLIRQGIIELCRLIAKSRKIHQNTFSYLNTISYYFQIYKEPFVLQNTGIIPQIVGFLEKGQEFLYPASLSILYHACKNNLAGIKLLFSLDILNIIQNFTNSGTQTIKCYAYRLLSALAEGIKEQSQFILQKKELIMGGFAELQNKYGYQVKEQILSLLANLAKTTPSDWLYRLYKEKRIVQKIADMLTGCVEQDDHAQNILMSLHKIFDFGNIYLEADKNTFVLTFIRQNGRNILDKLLPYSNQRTLNCALLLSMYLESQKQ